MANSTPKKPDYSAQYTSISSGNDTKNDNAKVAEALRQVFERSRAQEQPSVVQAGPLIGAVQGNVFVFGNVSPEMLRGLFDGLAPASKS